ncbi:aminotransferase class V-fold PLP-dependent enzyme [Parafrankia discariae]|uniref:aminotransferase class V-fold PLP-dependent enzyme n=1 Tax=Parafrankia discariae TaxID=365528 RepID=UPI0003791C79|nr:aminotransferase class V-fold PLP-dependent enzyme [Parafrankia discariae]
MEPHRRTTPALDADRTRASRGRTVVPEPEIGRRWRAARARAGVVHLDAAAAARPSIATVTDQTDHLRRENLVGAYIAEMEAAEVLTGARARLATLLGPGLTADDVVFQHSASTGFAALLAAWPLPPGSRVGVVPGEYGSNLLLLAARAARDGLELIELPVDPLGRIDLDRLDRPDRPDRTAGTGGTGGLEGLALVTFPHIPSQRGVVQPAAEVAARCAAAGVDLILDVAQSLGQVEVAGIGAAAYVGTSRKWLCGPRGAGFSAVRPDVVDRLGPGAPSLHSAHPHDLGARPAPPARPLPGPSRMAIGEAAVASRIGLATALAELLAEDLGAVQDRITALARHARRALDGVAGWRLGEEADSPTGIVTLRPPPGVDATAVCRALYVEARILTSPIPAGRAPELTAPVLRASPHVYSSPAEIGQLAEALDRWGRPAP